MIGIERKGRHVLSDSNSFSKVPQVEKHRTGPGRSQPTKPTPLVPTVQVETTEGPGQAGAAMVGPDGG